MKELGSRIPNVQLIDFDNRLEDLVSEASGVASMAGYNTFCEILSFDKPSLLLPRTLPREEQLIRAQRAAALGWATMLLPEYADDPETLAKVLRELPGRARPSEAASTADLLGGLDTIVSDVGRWLQERNIVSVSYGND